MDRVSTCDAVIKDTQIEEGTVIAIPTYVIHRDPKLWPDPEQFKPERYRHHSVVQCGNIPVSLTIKFLKTE